MGRGRGGASLGYRDGGILCVGDLHNVDALGDLGNGIHVNTRRLRLSDQLLQFSFEHRFRLSLAVNQPCQSLQARGTIRGSLHQGQGRRRCFFILPRKLLTQPVPYLSDGGWETLANILPRFINSFHNKRHRQRTNTQRHRIHHNTHPINHSTDTLLRQYLLFILSKQQRCGFVTTPLVGQRIAADFLLPMVPLR